MEIFFRIIRLFACAAVGSSIVAYAQHGHRATLVIVLVALAILGIVPHQQDP